MSFSQGKPLRSTITPGSGHKSSAAKDARSEKGSRRLSGSSSPATASGLNLQVLGRSAQSIKQSQTQRDAGSTRSRSSLGMGATGARTGGSGWSKPSLASSSPSRPESAPPLRTSSVDGDDTLESSFASERLGSQPFAQLERCQQDLDTQTQMLQVTNTRLQSAEDQLQLKETALARLRDENERLHRAQGSSGISVHDLGRQLAQPLGVSVSPTSTAEEIAGTLLEQVIRKVQQVQGLNSQVSQLNETVEGLCSKLATEQTSAQSLQTELSQAKNSLTSMKRENEDAKVKVASSSEERSRCTSHLDVLKGQVKALDARVQQAEETKARSEALKTVADAKVSGLTSNSEELQKRVAALTSECAQAKQAADLYKSQYCNEMSSIRGCLALDTSATSEHIVDTITALTEDRRQVAAANSKLKSSCTSAEMEIKANRETIMRLVADASAQQKSTTSQAEDVQHLGQEKRALAGKVERCERELRLLRSQLAASQDAMTMAQEEVTNKEAQVSSLGRSILDLKQSRKEQDLLLQQLQQFMAEAHCVLGKESPGTSAAGAMDGKQILVAMRTRIQSAESQARDQAETQETLRMQTTQLAGALERERAETTRCRTALARLQSKLEEGQLSESDLETELRRKEALCKDLESQSQAHSYFCQRLCESLKIEQLTKDFGSGMQTELIIGRVDLLQRQEGPLIAEKSAAIYGLQRRMKSTKASLESKTLHLEMMQTKVNTLEKRLVEVNTLLAEKQAAGLKLERALKKIDAQSATIHKLKETVTGLKAELHDVEPFEAKFAAQCSEVGTLEQKLKVATDSAKRHSKQMGAKQKTLEASQAQAEAEKDEGARECEVLHNELKAAQSALQEVRSREKQLLTMRSTMASLIGLDVNELAVPDYEIMSRLEQLVRAHETHISTARGVQSALQQLQHNFYSGYDEAMQFVGSAQTDSHALPTPSLTRLGQSAGQTSAQTFQSPGSLLPP